MNQSKALHRQAMDILDQAWMAQRQGDLEKAKQLWQESYAVEKAAAELVDISESNEPSRSILFKSAASIAIQCGMLREADRMLHSGLAGYPTGKVLRELEQLLDDTTFKRHLEVHGIQLSSDDVQMSLAGDGIGPGIAPMQHVVARLNSTKLLLFRTAERKFGRPYRDAGKPTDRIREVAQAFVSIPRAASFAMSISVGSLEQQSLAGLGNSEAVVDDLLDCLEMFDSGSENELRLRIDDPAYFNNFVALARSIAPDGNVVRTVGFTARRGDGIREVAMRRTFEESQGAFLPYEGKSQPSDLDTIRFIGRVLFADSTKRIKSIKIVGEDERITDLVVPEGLMSDIVRPLWNEWVEVTARYQRRKLHLVEVRPILE